MKDVFIFIFIRQNLLELDFAPTVKTEYIWAHSLICGHVTFRNFFIESNALNQYKSRFHILLLFSRGLALELFDCFYCIIYFTALWHSRKMDCSIKQVML